MSLKTEKLKILRHREGAKRPRQPNYLCTWKRLLQKIFSFFTFHVSPRRAFTLAEILIVITIIGTIATISIPPLVKNYQEQEYKVAYKKAYSDANNALKDMLRNYEYQTRTGSSDASATLNNFIAFKNKFRVQKECFSNNRGECFALTSADPTAECGEFNTLPDGTAGACVGTVSVAFVDSSGRGWSTWGPWGAGQTDNVFLVDTNGHKKPNKLGRDRWTLSFTTKADNYSANAVNAEIIMPVFDDYGPNKTRWCPSGNCYYCTYLFDTNPCH